MSVLKNNKGLTLLGKVHTVRDKSQAGLTLIEILISLVILLLVFLGLLQTSMLTMDVNVNNLLREEAVSIAENRMRELREMSAANIDAAAAAGTVTVTRTFRNMAPRPYDVTISVTNIPVASPVAKQLEVLVTWATPKEPLVMLSHTITTMKRL